MTPGADWPEQAHRLAESLRGAFAGAAAHVPPAGPDAPAECRWCPLCQFLAVLRGDRPEVTAALADVLRATADALHAFAAAPDAPRPPQDAPGPEDGPTDPPPVVQRIEIA